MSVVMERWSAPQSVLGVFPMKPALVIFCIIIAIWLSPKFSQSSNLGFLTEQEQETISVGIRNIANNLRRRSCIFEAERVGLSQINSVLQNHKSDYRIVMWDLPERTCNE